jgi:hypothetical protein
MYFISVKQALGYPRIFGNNYIRFSQNPHRPERYIFHIPNRRPHDKKF